MRWYTQAVPIIFNIPESKVIRRSLRRNQTTPEDRLWYYIRDRRLNGIKFRRQYSIGLYVVDFYCPKARLVIELDGDSHFTPEAETYDQKRQALIEACNVRVLRFTNLEIMKNIEGVIELIAALATSPPPSP